MLSNIILAAITGVYRMFLNAACLLLYGCNLFQELGSIVNLGIFQILNPQ